jgi:hypothetical protein
MKLKQKKRGGEHRQDEKSGTNSKKEEEKCKPLKRGRRKNGDLRYQVSSYEKLLLKRTVFHCQYSA